MRRMAMALAVLAVGVAACGGTGGSSDSDGAPVAKGTKLEPADITLWVGFTSRELGVIKDTVKEFEAENPQVKVKVVGGINDDKIIAASRGGKSPDVAQSFSADNAGAFCGSGAWINLKQYMDRDGISASIFPPAPRSYTQFDGTRCSLPMLAEAYALYYNEDMLKNAGLNGPPKTASELVDYA